MTTRTKKKPRAAAAIRVSPVTEWTDFHGILELFGLRRSTAYHLVNEGSIKSVSLRHEHEKRGKRLFHVPSIRAYLNAKLKEGQSVKNTRLGMSSQAGARNKASKSSSHESASHV